MRTARIACLSLVLLLAAGVPAAAAPTLLRLDGIGPLELGMSRAAAVKTGWLSNRRLGCELALPRPITYALDGPRAPRALKGSVVFDSGRLTNVAISAGATTKVGVTPGKTTVSKMVTRYRRAGYKATSRFDATFQATFVTVKRRSKQVLSGLAQKKVVDLVSLPYTPVCE